MNDFFRGTKVVAAVRSEADITNCLKSNSRIVFLLFGTLLSVPGYVKQLKNSGKSVFVHLDLIEGLSSSRSSVDYIKSMTEADGLISIKLHILKYGKDMGFKTILRIFILDSKSLENIDRINSDDEIDFLEILPGIALTLIPDTVVKIKKQIIGGGLIHSPEQIQQILAAGAAAVSTSDCRLWK